MVDDIRPYLDGTLRPRGLVTRFAPSPTGYLHLGHVVNAIYVWGIARSIGARVLLRVEDHDRIRCRPEYEAALLEDLDWLGFEADEGRTPVVRQRDRADVYLRALDRLRTAAHVFACDCSRRAIGGPRYDGRCRTRHLAEAGAGLRVQMDPGVEHALDALRGPLAQDPALQCGDLLVRDRDGQWTYQFAVTADDVAQQVTLVIRGADIEDSTGRQIRLARWLGQTAVPVYVHHPLLAGPDGRKLSKSQGDTGIRELRARGMDPADVIGLAAAGAGLLPRAAPVPASAVPALVDRVLG